MSDPNPDLDDPDPVPNSDVDPDSKLNLDPDPDPETRPDLAVDAEFALLLTHDVDRPYKSVQALYHAIRRRDPGQLLDLLPGVNPWWRFDDVMELERSLGVRSAFYFLREPHVLSRHPRRWLDPFYWIEHVGRYDLEAPEMLGVLERLREGGWEVGLHGSYDAHDDPARLGAERVALEAALGESVTGGRQHHLHSSVRTWHHYREQGLCYDASLGSADAYGFRHGYRPFRPFGDEFVVFPLTAMETALPDPGEDFERAWRACERLLDEAADDDAVMTVLWHPRLFATDDFPGYRRLYRRLVERALDRGAWVGPPADYYAAMDHPDEPDDDHAASPDDADGTGDASGRHAVGQSGPRSDGDGTDDDRGRVPPPQAADNEVPPPPNTEPTG